MQQLQPKYKFYATLLDAFLWYQVSESDNAEQEFIDKINRVPITDPKALERMAKGTALNNLVDKQVVNETMNEAETMSEIVNGMTFTFDSRIVNQLGDKLQGSIPQYYTETIIRCNGNNVLVYGYIDYILTNKIIDLKTTKTYELGKYKDSMQMHLYPICLYNEEGIIADEFEFLITDFNEVYSEVYPINLIDSNTKLAITCNALIEFIESKKEFITNKKIFGLE